MDVNEFAVEVQDDATEEIGGYMGEVDEDEVPFDQAAYNREANAAAEAEYLWEEQNARFCFD